MSLPATEPTTLPPTTTEEPVDGLAADRDSFVWVDFVVFGLFLCISLSVGAFFAWKSRQKRLKRPTDSGATLEFLMGGRKMPMIPIALSLLTTFLSGVTMLGTPSEIYLRGLLFWVYYMTAGLAFAVSGLFFIPIFYQLQPISVYEYFEHRFDSKALRVLTSALFLVNTSFYMAVVLFSPAVALGGVTGIHEAVWIMIVGVVCTLYTSIGGLKAVVWTDTLQAVFMYGGIAVMLIRGVQLSGGIHAVWDAFEREGRVDVLSNWDADPLQHNSMLISIFGGFCLWMSLYGLNQMALQRYCSMPTLRHSRYVVFMTVPMFAVLGSLACFVGVVMFAYFNQTCDPMLDPTVEIKSDQLVILFAVRTLRALPGLPGLFLATLFSATLSTFSSGMNSQAAVLWEDFLKPHLSHRLNDDTAARLNKFLVLGFGALATGMAFLAGPIGGIMKSAFTLIGALGGPLIGCFFLGVFVPFANKFGVFVGLAVAGVINIGIPLGNIITKPYANYRLSLNDTCLAEPKNVTDIYGDTSVFFPFRISIYLYPLMGITVTMVLGALVSLCWRDAKADLPEERRKRRQLTVFRSNERQSVYDVEMRNREFNRAVPARDTDDAPRKEREREKEWRESSVTFH